jgi:hypothetical protein
VSRDARAQTSGGAARTTKALKSEPKELEQQRTNTREGISTMVEEKYPRGYGNMIIEREKELLAQGKDVITQLDGDVVVLSIFEADE